MVTVRDYTSRAERFKDLRKFKKEHPNAKVLEKWHMQYGDGCYVRFYTVYSAKIEY